MQKPTQTLSFYAHGRNNNFNLIRFFAALIVILSHSFPLTGNLSDPLGMLAGISFGHLAVDIFFITSGFLVTASLLKRPHLTSFVTSRIARIFPGLIIAVAFCAYIIGPLFTSLPLMEYLKSPDTHNFFIYNSLLVVEPIRYSLPGVFEHLPYKHAVNGSLWTLPWEIYMYTILAGIGLISLFPTSNARHNQILQGSITIIAIIAIIATMTFLLNNAKPFISVPDLPHLTRFTYMFFIGGVYYIYRNNIPLSKKIFFPLTLAVTFLFIFPGALTFPLYSLALPYIVLYLAYVPGGAIRNFNKLGDYSYGLYIYAFPIQQTIVHLYQIEDSLLLFLIAAPSTLLLAMFSWHIVEKPILNRWRNKPVNERERPNSP